jgi:hypothetical protein
VGSYKRISDKERYDKVEKLEKLENPAAPAQEGKVFHKK